MPRPGAPRLHRLPQRLDWTLVPAPLDLSLPSLTEKSEKSPLPSIIVTPSDGDRFSIAFIAPPQKPSIKERVSNSLFSFRARTTILLFFIVFIMICHLIAHKMATHRPHLEFTVQDSGNGWLFWTDAVQVDNKRDFIIEETSL